jgi:hypothetical protein
VLSVERNSSNATPASGARRADSISAATAERRSSVCHYVKPHIKADDETHSIPPLARI